MICSNEKPILTNQSSGKWRYGPNYVKMFERLIDILFGDDMPCPT
jgi:hypothetical protein